MQTLLLYSSKLILQNVQAFSQSDSLETFRHLIFILRSIHDYDPVESPTAVEVVTRHVLQVNRRAPSMIPRKPEETVAVKKPSPPTSAGGQERQERVNKCNGCTFNMFIESQTLLKCSDCMKECHQACCNDKGICVICTGMKTPSPVCSVCGMRDATSICTLCKKAVCPGKPCLSTMGCCSPCVGERPAEVLQLMIGQQGRVLAFLIGFHFIFSCQSIQGRPNPRIGHPSYVPVGAGKCLRLLIVTNAYGAIILFVRVSIALSSVKEETSQFTAIRGCVELVTGNGLLKGTSLKMHRRRSGNTKCFKKD